MRRKSNRNILIALLTFILIWGVARLSAVPVHANSAPSYWGAFPYSDVLSVKKDSPIAVEHEHLTFDFSETSHSGYYFSPAARVLAEYRMTNPTGDTHSVQMAFPFVARLSGFSASDITVSADGVPVPFDIYIDPEGVKASGTSRESFLYDYGSIGEITNQVVTLPGFDLDSNAKLYRFYVSGNEEERLDLEISFPADKLQTLLIGDGFDAYSYSPESGHKLQCRVRDNAEAEILVLGKEPVLTWEVLTAEGNKADQNQYHLAAVQDSAAPKEYLLRVVRENIARGTADEISETQLLKLCLHQLREVGLGSGFAVISDVIAPLFSDHIFTLVYQVDFPPQSTKSVSVGYIAEGSMDGRETVSPKHNYTYLLSPAKNWADFGSLDIEIFTPPEAPYIIGSSLALSKSDDNRYSAQFDGLPESELTFTLYEHERVTLIHKAEKSIAKASYLFFFFWPVILIILVVIAVFAGRKIIRRIRGY